MSYKELLKLINEKEWNKEILVRTIWEEGGLQENKYGHYYIKGKKELKFIFEDITNKPVEIKLIINPEGEDRILFELEEVSDGYLYYSLNVDTLIPGEKEIISFFGDGSYILEIDEEGDSTEIIEENLDKYQLYYLPEIEE